jgi:hypothetical protein
LKTSRSPGRSEIRQSSGIELGIDSPSELGFAGTIDTLGRRFAPHPTAIPDITVEAAPLHLYDELSTVQLVDAA